MKYKTSLVLEGGGMRGVYTAGALTWLIDHGIEFDNAYGISTGAVHLCNFLLKDKKNLFDFSVDYIADKKAMFLPALIRSGHIVDYDYLFNNVLINKAHYDMSKLKSVKTNGKVGVYDLNVGKTIYLDVKNMSVNELKASTSLPLIGKVVKENGREILDGGITEMIPISESINDGCNKHLIITTKPAGYTRKPAKKAIVKLMSFVYSKCPNIGKDYEVRHINYQKQIAAIKDLENKDEAVYIFPSKTSKVTRLGGKREELIELFELGKSDMEARKEEIFKLLGINA